MPSLPSQPLIEDVEVIITLPLARDDKAGVGVTDSLAKAFGMIKRRGRSEFIRYQKQTWVDDHTAVYVSNSYRPRSTRLVQVSPGEVR